MKRIALSIARLTVLGMFILVLPIIVVIAFLSAWLDSVLPDSDR